MQPLTATAFVLAGLALDFLGTRRRRAAAMVLLPLAAISLTALAAHWIGLFQRIDTLLFPTGVMAQNLRYPGRMPEITAVEFLLFCLFAAWPRKSPRLYRSASQVATLGLLIALIALAGYLLDARDLARVGGVSSMAVHSALGFVLLFVGGLLAQRDHNWLKLLLTSSATGGLTCRLLIHIIAWPVVLGMAITFFDPRAGNSQLEFAIYVVALLGVLAMVVLRFAKRLQRSETQRDQAIAVLRTTEARLTRILASTLDGVITTDEARRIVFFNPAAEKIFGCPAAEAIGQPIDRFVPEDVRIRHAGHMRQFGETGMTSRVMGRLDTLSALRSDGSEFPIEASVSHIQVDHQQFFTVILRDITERTQAEKSLQDSERRLALALDASGSAVWEMDVATGVIRGDDLLFTMLGYSPGELETLADWIDIVHEDDRQGMREMVSEIILGKRERSQFEARLRAKDGSWRWNLSRAVVAERDARGQALRLVGTHTDTTSRKTTEAEIQRLNAELEQRVQRRTAQLETSNAALMRSNMELQHFAHAAAHDLQTPLRSIAGFAQLAQQDFLKQEDLRGQEWLSLVIENTKRLQGLIQALLAYTRVESQGVPFVTTDLRDVADEVAASLADLIRETGTELSCGYLPTLPVDRRQMAFLLQKLIINGIKYNRSTPPKVSIDSTLLQGEWLISVKDNGIGIDPKHHDRIFEIFRRLHTYGQIPGTGIGLALCKHIVERHGGRIWVESQPGKGSTFLFTLPAGR